MNATELLNQFKSMGIQLHINGSKIKYRIPEPVVKKHPELNQLLAELKAHKQEAIELLSQQKKQWVEPELKPVRAILLWSELLQNHFWWLIDKSILPEIQRDGVPVYDDQEIGIMLDARDNVERQKLHSFKKTFNATICKNKINDERR
ncbi:MAG: hypothetical protein M1381_11780 [Deltaproteobacteria bacterium]|nr:hypothetical protein [Deltaproteobacteria bacterium]